MGLLGFQVFSQHFIYPNGLGHAQVPFSFDLLSFPDLFLLLLLPYPM